jgi:glycosyltransferase involved in cell wall biosynthesis
MKLITIVIPTFNEALNIERLYISINKILEHLKNKYHFHFIIIDNCSTDSTVLVLKEIAKKDKNFKIIINNRNFGHIRSPYYGILQSYGDATIYMASDFQDPPELLLQFIKKWEEGSEIVFAQKIKSNEKLLLKFLRILFYFILKLISDIDLLKNVTGFGIYDKKVISNLKKINDPMPFLRGLVVELGFKIDLIKFTQPLRKTGFTKNNYYTLIDNAILGLVSHSVFPLRLITLCGLPLSLLCFFSAVAFFILKLIFWDEFIFGLASLIIIVFILFGILLLFLSFVSEYILNFRCYIQNRPLVIERERINFDEEIK